MPGHPEVKVTAFELAGHPEVKVLACYFVISILQEQALKSIFQSNYIPKELYPMFLTVIKKLF